MAKRRESGDNVRLPPEAMMRQLSIGTVRRLGAIGFAAAIFAACAPDAMNNVQATGYNAFLNRIATSCNPLMIGSRDMSYKILHNDSSDDSNYNYFLDLTSQLYYGKVSPDAYRSGVSGFLGGGADTNRSLDCIMATLYSNRASSGGALPAPPKPIY